MNFPRRYKKSARNTGIAPLLAEALLAILIFMLFPALQCSASSGEIHVIHASGPVSPPMAGFVCENLNDAETSKANCCIIELDTPGGLAEPMREIVMCILASKIPVVVYVSPSGARAASAGVMITMAADVAAMAPGTNIGAAHPVGIGGKDLPETMTEKIINDMVANAKSVAEKRGRNAEWVEKAIKESVSVTETQALEKNIINLTARDLNDLLEKLDGMAIPDKGTIKTKDAVLIFAKETIRDKILKIIGSPNWAFVFLMLGLAGLYFEFTNPGAILPGVIGGLCLILAAYSFSLLPVNYVGVLLIIAAAVLFVLETQIPSHGALSIGGVVCLALGAVMLFDYKASGIRVAWSVLIPSIIMTSAFFVTVAWLVAKSHMKQPRTGEDGMIGKTGKVIAAASLQKGKVMIHAEIWNAVFSGNLSPGDEIVVKAIDGLVLTVEKAENK